jgi:hypothetical protein
MLYILNEKYLSTKYVTNTDCNSLWLHGKKHPGYLLHNVTPFAINSSSEALDAFIKKLITELLIVFEGYNKVYLTGYKYKVTNNKIYSNKKNFPKLELLIGQGVDVNSLLALNVDYLKKQNFNYYTLIENVGTDIIINWELLLYLLKKLNKAFMDNMILSKLINTLSQFNIYHSLTDKLITYNLLCINYQKLFNHSPSILYRVCKMQLRNKCINQIKKIIQTELLNTLKLIGD